MIPIVNVTFTAFDQSGAPVVGGRITARLDKTETYNGFVVPEEVSATTDASGVAVLPLWPNALGVAGSLYRVRAWNPDTGRKFLDTTISVPNSNCALEQIIVQEPLPPIDAAQQALLAAQGALAPVTAQAALATAKASVATDAAEAAEISTVAALAHSQTAAAERQYAWLARDDADAFASTANASAGAAASSAATATTKAAEALASEVAAELAKDDAIAAAGAIGPIKFYGTHALATEALGSLVNGDLIEVAQDETRAGARTRYKVQAGALVFVVNLDQTKLDLAVATGASRVGFQQEGTGAVSTTVQSKLREFVSVQDFGAVGDGVTDDRNAIVNALTAAAGRDVILEGGKTYLIGSPIVYLGDVSIKSDGADKAIIWHNGQAFDPITIRGSLAAITTLTSAQQINNRGWDVASVSGVQPGMLMEVISSASWYHDPRPETTDARKSELHRVAYISGSTVFAEDPANDGYNVPTETVTVNLYAPVSVRMENIAVRCVLPTPAVGAPTRVGISVCYANEPVLVDVDVENAAAVGISIKGCYRAVVERGHTHSANAYFTGYGVQTLGSAHTAIRGRTFFQCRRGVDVSGVNVVSRHTLIEACTNLGGGVNSAGTVYGWTDAGAIGAPQFGFGSHGPADHTIYRGNTVAQMHTPFNLRGRSEIVEDNYIIGRTRFGAIELSFGENVWIRNNKVYTGWSNLKDSTIYEGGGNSNTRRADWFARFHSTYQGGEIVIENNDVQVQDRFISFNSGGVQANITVARNKVRFATQSGTDPVYLAYNEGASQNVSNWRLEDNNYARNFGTGSVNRFFNLTLSASAPVGDFVYSSTYTPTLTNVTNVAASTAYLCAFMRVGDVVTVSGRVAIDPTAAGAIKLRMSLPVAAPNLDAIHLGGTGNTSLSDMPLAISGDTTKREASFDGVVTNAANRFVCFNFTYSIA